jgi:hypothetical protein
MSDAVLYNALAWAINGSSHYSTNVAGWINTWFIANDTHMNPNLNYGQVVRGPGQTSRTGRSSGVIDLKCMVKVVNAVLVLRMGQAPGWTSAIDSGLVNWTKSYIKWLTSSQVALGEAVAPKCVALISPQPFKRQTAVTCFTNPLCFVLQQPRVVLLQPACGTADPRERHCWRQYDNSKVLLYIV